MEKLEESQQLQQEIAEGQRDSLEYQRQLVENGTFLSAAIEASRGSVQEMMAEFKMSTMEQTNMIFERTAGARLWLFLLLTVIFGVERAVINQ